MSVTARSLVRLSQVRALTAADISLAQAAHSLRAPRPFELMDVLPSSCLDRDGSVRVALFDGELDYVAVISLDESDEGRDWQVEVVSVTRGGVRVSFVGARGLIAEWLETKAARELKLAMDA